MAVKMIERIFNKHPVKSVAISVCMASLIVAYLLFGSGLINWDKIHQNYMQVVAQYEEYKASQVEEDTDIKPDDSVEKIADTKNCETVNAQAEDVSNELKYIDNILASILYSFITLLQLGVAVALLVYVINHVSDR